MAGCPGRARRWRPRRGGWWGGGWGEGEAGERRTVRVERGGGGGNVGRRDSPDVSSAAGRVGRRVRGPQPPALIAHQCARMLRRGTRASDTVHPAPGRARSGTFPPPTRAPHRWLSLSVKTHRPRPSTSARISATRPPGPPAGGVAGARGRDVPEGGVPPAGGWDRRRRNMGARAQAGGRERASAAFFFFFARVPGGEEALSTPFSSLFPRALFPPPPAPPPHRPPRESVVC